VHFVQLAVTVVVFYLNFKPVYWVDVDGFDGTSEPSWSLPRRFLIMRIDVIVAFAVSFSIDSKLSSNMAEELELMSLLAQPSS